MEDRQMKYDSICNQFWLSVLCVHPHIYSLFVIDELLLALQEISRPICILMTPVMIATLRTWIHVIFTISRSQVTISMLSNP